MQLAHAGIGLPEGSNRTLLKSKIDQFFLNMAQIGKTSVLKSEWLDFYSILFD